MSLSDLPKMGKTSIAKTSIAKTSIAKTSMAQTSIAKTSMTKTSIAKSMTITKTSITKSSIANSSGQNNRSSSNGSNSILSPHSSTGTNGIASSSSSRQGDNRKGTHQSCFSLTLLASIKSETSIVYSCWKSSRNSRGYSNRGSCNSSNRSLATKSSTCTRSIASGGKLRDGYNWKCVSSIMSKKEASISFSLLATIEAKT